MKTMNFFWHMNVMDAIMICILVLVVLGAFLWVFYNVIKEWWRDNKLKKAKKLLKKDLDEKDDFEKQLKHYKDLYYGKQDVILSRGLFETLLNYLPSPNECVNNLSLIKDIKSKKYGMYEFRTTHFVPGDGISITILPLNISMKIIHRKDSLRSTMCGIEVNVDTYCWDFGASGIRILSDDDFLRVISFIASSHKVANETGLLDYAKGV